VIEEQVARGSRIYESGHFVVLVWGNSQRDLEAVERILSQVRPPRAGCDACGTAMRCACGQNDQVAVLLHATTCSMANAAACAI
jgi:hypothetical protein